MAGVTSSLVSDNVADDEERKTEDLARSLLDYLRMRLREYPHQGFIVEISELAFRFREREWALESRGQATPTDFKGLWRLRVPSSAGGQSKNLLEGNSNQRIPGLKTKRETSS